MKRRILLTGFLLGFLSGLGGMQAQEAAPASPQSPATVPPTVTPKPSVLETVVVTAPGEVRSEQVVDRTMMLESAPGTSPIQVLAELPSVNFTTADPYGSYEWATRISVRGFNQNQLGFTLDDIPLGDMSYGNWNGLHISRAIMDENMGRILLSQGTGALETASNSNLGGTVEFFSLDPSDQASFSFHQSFGSFAASRSVVRLESGLHKQTKFYLTGAYQLTNKWRGAGDIGQNYWQANGKLVHYFGQKGVLTTFIDISDRREVDYQDVNKIWVKKLGYNWDNYGNWSKAIQAAYAYNGVGSYPDPVNRLSASEDQVDAAYYGGSGLRKDIIGGVTYRLALTSKLTWKTTGYGHRNDGRGLWFTPYLGSPTTGSPISLRTSEYGISRGGFLTSLSYETQRNKLEGGVWFEGENFDLARRFYATNIESPGHSLYSFPSKPFYTQWAYAFGSTVYQFHLQDSYKVNRKLTLSAGFKSINTDIDGKLAPYVLTSPLYTPGAYAQGSLSSGKPFLPQIGGSYKFDGHNEVFADVAYNVRSYVPGGYGFGNSPWGTTQSGFEVLRKTLKPETSWSEEAGYRLEARKLKLQASFFHVNFFDRLLAIAQGSGIAGNASLLSNVGGVTTNGVDAAATVQLGSGISFYNGATWNKSSYDDDVTRTDGSVVYATKGKLSVDAPKGLYKTQLHWKRRELFANIGADYMSKRYFTYSNDGEVGGRFLADLSGGYEREQLGALKDLKLQFNIYNLAGAKYFASIGTNGFVYSDPNSLSNPTLQVGAPRTFVGGFSFKF